MVNTLQDVLPNLVTAWAEGRPGLAPNSVLPDSFPQTPAAKPAPAVKAAPAPQPPVAKPVAPPVEVPVAVAVASHEGASTPEQRAVSPEPVVANNVVPCGSSHQGAGGCTVASKRSPAQKVSLYCCRMVLSESHLEILCKNHGCIYAVRCTIRTPPKCILSFA